MVRRMKEGVLAAILMVFVAVSVPALPVHEMQRGKPPKEPEKVKEKEKPKRDGDQGGSRGRDDQKRKEQPKRKPFF